MKAVSLQSPMVTGGGVSSSPYGATGPHVTPNAWNGGGSVSTGGGMLEELGMSGDRVHGERNSARASRADGGGKGYVEFGSGSQGSEKRAAPTPPPRNASAQKKTPQTQDRVIY